MMPFGATVVLACGALALEAAFGYPDALFRRLGHPVSWIGRWLALLERVLNRPAWSFSLRRCAGVVTLVVLLGATAAVTQAIGAILPGSWLGYGILALLGASLPAQRSLFAHVGAVADALQHEGLAGGRRAVSMIVGRNPDRLDEAAVVRAAIESLAENFSDGVVAPALWMALGGLTGGALYKAANTADSMIGHRNTRYDAFGWAAARFDDLVNLPASRLAAFWLVLASLLVGADAVAAVDAVRRDASRHRSPNAGWPEAAMAGALDLRLGGPRVYGDTLVEDAFMGRGRPDATVADIRRALDLYRVACLVQGAALLLLVLLLRA